MKVIFYDRKSGETYRREIDSIYKSVIQRWINEGKCYKCTECPFNQQGGGCCEKKGFIGLSYRNRYNITIESDLMQLFD